MRVFVLPVQANADCRNPPPDGSIQQMKCWHQLRLNLQHFSLKVKLRKTFGLKDVGVDNRGLVYSQFHQEVTIFILSNPQFVYRQKIHFKKCSHTAASPETHADDLIDHRCTFLCQILVNSANKSPVTLFCTSSLMLVVNKQITLRLRHDFVSFQVKVNPFLFRSQNSAPEQTWNSLSAWKINLTWNKRTAGVDLTVWHAGSHVSFPGSCQF